MNYVKRILTLMQEKNISAHKLEVDCELANASVQGWRNGRCKPSVLAVIRIAEYFDVSLDFLLKGENHKEKEEKNFMQNNGIIQNNKNTNNQENTITINNEKQKDTLLDQFVTEWNNLSKQQKLYFIDMAKLENTSSRVNIIRDKQIDFLNNYFSLTGDDTFMRIVDIFQQLSKKGDLIPFYCALYNFLQENDYEVAEWLKELIEKQK